MAVDAEDGGTTVVVNAEPGAGVAATVNTRAGGGWMSTLVVVVP